MFEFLKIIEYLMLKIKRFFFLRKEEEKTSEIIFYLFL